MIPDRPRGLWPAPTYYGTWLVVAGFVTQFVSVSAQNYATGAFMLPMIDEFGWTRAEFILPRSLGQFVMSFAGFFIGAPVDRPGARRVMFAGFVACALSLLGLSLLPVLCLWNLLDAVPWCH